MTILVIGSTTFSSVSHDLKAQAQSEEDKVKSTYSSKKDKINENLKNTKAILDDLKSSYGETTSQKRTYQDEKKSNENEIDKNNKNLTDYKYAVAQLDDQIETKQAEIETRKSKIGIILKQIWQEKEGSTIEILLNSESFSQIITGLNQLSNLEDSLLVNVKSLDQAKTLLEADRVQKVATQKDLEDAQTLLNANKQKLEALIQEYSNNEAKYASDILKKEQEAKESQNQLAGLQKEQEAKLAEIRKRREEELAKQAEIERLAKQTALANTAAPVTPTSATNPNAKNVVAQNTGTKQYGSCNSSTMPGSFPIKFGTLETPTSGAVTQRYGSTTLSNSIYDCHTGIDFANSCGTPLVAADDGIVYASDYAAGGYGNFIVLELNYGSKGTLYALYGHMKAKSSLAIGTRVSKGDLVGYMGNTGFSTGCHLHFTLIDGESMIYSRSRTGSSPVGLYYNPLEYLSA